MRVIDFMPPRGRAPDIVRIVEGLGGSVPMRSELVIRFDYGRIVPWVRRVDDARIAIAGPDALCLRTPADAHGEDLTTVSEFTLEPVGDPVRAHVVSVARGDARAGRPEQALTIRRRYWLDWAALCAHQGDYHEEIHSVPAAC